MFVPIRVPRYFVLLAQLRLIIQTTYNGLNTASVQLACGFFGGKHSEGVYFEILIGNIPSKFLDLCSDLRIESQHLTP